MGAVVGLMFASGVLLIVHRPKPSNGRSPLTRWNRRRRERLRQAGLDRMTPAQLVGAQVGCAVVAALLVLVVTRAGTIALCFAAFAFAAPVAAVSRLHRRRQLALRELWPEAVDHLASAVRAGMSLPEGLSALAVRGPEQLRPPFARFAAAYRVSGRFGPCLDSLKTDLADPVGDRICETVRVAREVGGSDVGAVLRALSELLRADARTRSELETRQGWVVNAARLAVAAPWVVLVMLGTQSGTLQVYDSASGVILLGVGAAVCVVAYRVMLRIGRLPDERRVLT